MYCSYPYKVLSWSCHGKQCQKFVYARENTILYHIRSGQENGHKLYSDLMSKHVVTMMLFSNLFQYFNKTHELWASEPSGKCKDGDIVLVRTLDEPQSDKVKHYVKELVFDIGNVKDPLTGRRCRGPDFAGNEKFLESMRKISTNKMKNLN